MEVLTRKAVARGIETLFDVCAEALLSEPSEQVLQDLKAVAGAIGDERFNDVTASAELTQRYYDRFFVPTSPVYVALQENCLLLGHVRKSADAEPCGFEYGPISGRISRHVQGCYDAVGFDQRALLGYEPMVSTLREDSLAAECAFFAFLKRAEATAGTNEEAEHAAKLAEGFARMHLIPFANAACSLVASLPAADDLYGRLCLFIRDNLQMLQGETGA